MRRNVLMLITGAFTIGGGVAAVNRLVMKALSERQSENNILTVFCLHEPPGITPDPFYIDGPDRTVKGFGGRYRAFVMETWRQTLSREYDLIIADYPGVASALFPLPFLGLCSYVVFCFGLELSAQLLSWRRKTAMIHASRRLAISQTTRCLVADRFPDLPVDVCELALDPKIPCPGKGDKRPSPILQAVSGEEKQLGPQVILCVGRMWSDQQHKGQDSLIAAMPMIRKKFPLAQLVLAGSGDLIGELKESAKNQRVADAVFFPGYTSDDLLSRLYKDCYAFAMPSKGEGFGLVYLEAMNWAKPCIGGSLDAAKDVIVDNKTGILMKEPHNPLEIADAITLLFSKPELAAEMGAAGLQRLKEKFLFPKFCERFYHVLEWD